MPVKGESLSGLLKHSSPRQYHKRAEQKAETLEKKIIKALQECPESRLFKGFKTKDLSITDRELEKALQSFRVALNDFPELIPELKSFL